LPAHGCLLVAARHLPRNDCLIAACHRCCPMGSNKASLRILKLWLKKQQQQHHQQPEAAEVGCGQMPKDSPLKRTRLGSNSQVIKKTIAVAYS